mgnify:CR=1 FL=1
MEEFSTLREKIMKLLSETKEPLSVDEICCILNLPLSERDRVYESLIHIAKTIRRQSKGKKQLLMVPPQCRNCGFIFKNLNKPKKPSKCPKCKSQRIDPPKFIIK